MSTKFDYQSAAPEAVRPLYEAGKLLAQSSLEPNLLALVSLRASQINGCAFCLALHTREAHALGETADRQTGLPAWRETPWYTARERVALEWTEALTKLSQAHPSSDALARVREQFTDREVAYLTLAVTLINSWNRFAVGFGVAPEGADAVFKMLHPEAAAAHA